MAVGVEAAVVAAAALASGVLLPFLVGNWVVGLIVLPEHRVRRAAASFPRPRLCFAWELPVALEGQRGGGQPVGVVVLLLRGAPVLVGVVV